MDQALLKSEFGSAVKNPPLPTRPCFACSIPSLAQSAPAAPRGRREAGGLCRFYSPEKLVPMRTHQKKFEDASFNSGATGSLSNILLPPDACTAGWCQSQAGLSPQPSSGPSTGHSLRGAEERVQWHSCKSLAALSSSLQTQAGEVSDSWGVPFA